MKKNNVWMKSAGMVLAMTILCGVLYTLVVTILSQLLFTANANGSIIEIDGKKYGCELLAQNYTGEEYMWGRIMNPSAFTDQDGNTKMYSGPSNLSPNSPEYAELIDARVEKILAANPDATTEEIPVDLVTCSGSGLDPHISLAAANYQIPRIAKQRGMTEEAVAEIIEASAQHKILGFLGEEIVNVLEVNLRLDGVLK